MRNHVGIGLSPAKKLVLSAAGVLAVTAPIGLGIVNASAIRAQSAPPKEKKSFEVASVKRLPQPSSSTSTGGGPGTADPGRWWRSNVTMASLLVQAFHIQGQAIAGPEWLSSSAGPRYEIVARVPAGANRDDVPLMLQNLLIERFGLKFHREQKQMPAYVLAIGRSGLKLKPSTDTPGQVPHRDGYPDLAGGIAPGVIQVDSAGLVRRLAAGAMSMAQFADYLAGQNDLPIVDATGLGGKYDIVFYYSRPAPLSTDSPAIPAESGLDLRSALREQLGLELQNRKAQVDVLVIDHIEQAPAPN
jgi:uncharacterized protein (TIGR03435 family)